MLLFVTAVEVNQVISQSYQSAKSSGVGAAAPTYCTSSFTVSRTTPLAPSTQPREPATSTHHLSCHLNNTRDTESCDNWYAIRIAVSDVALFCFHQRTMWLAASLFSNCSACFALLRSVYVQKVSTKYD